MAINIGIAVYFPVRSLSIFLLRLCSLLSFGFTTVFEHKSDIKENLISAIAAARSRPRSASICKIMCSIVSFSFCVSLSFSSISLSPSIILLAAKRTGICASFA